MQQLQDLTYLTWIFVINAWLSKHSETIKQIEKIMEDDKMAYSCNAVEKVNFALDGNQDKNIQKHMK